MLSVVCAGSAEISKKIAKFEPEIIMVEPPELVGTGIAVSKVKPEVVSRTVEEIKKLIQTYGYFVAQVSQVKKM